MLSVGRGEKATGPVRAPCARALRGSVSPHMQIHGAMFGYEWQCAQALISTLRNSTSARAHAACAVSPYTANIDRCSTYHCRMTFYYNI
ncbi:hypothetical protein EVAR_15893_1 [Eumeta japonica]|uniref:Uncharacterized protein n=1 Tax=Eumeta variegata TaxID=151549 RepID=A0A4C1UEZ3_EUMVA|nr:hypothetical protein EVAR_15893_1 [Eumeta japonica]